MAAAVALIVAAVALIAVIHPLLKRVRERGAGVADGPSHLQQLLDQRETLLRAMRELEFDRGLGNLAEEEYRSLREDYERQTAGVMKALEARANGLAEQIEEEVLVLRHQQAPPTASATLACPACGAPLRSGDRYCSTCGQRPEAGPN